MQFTCEVLQIKFFKKQALCLFVHTRVLCFPALIMKPIFLKRCWDGKEDELKIGSNCNTRQLNFHAYVAPKQLRNINYTVKMLFSAMTVCTLFHWNFQVKDYHLEVLLYYCLEALFVIH